MVTNMNILLAVISGGNVGGKCIAPSPGYNEVVQQFEQPLRESFKVHK